MSYKATKSLKKGELVGHVPLSAGMSVSSAMLTPIVLIVQDFAEISPITILSLHLLYEKYYNASAWQPFIKTIPYPHKSSSLNLQTKYLSELKGSHALEIIQERLDSVLNQYQLLYNLVVIKHHLLTDEQFSYDNFKWSMGIVWSYSVILPIENNTYTPILIPIFSYLTPIKVKSNSVLKINNTNGMIELHSTTKIKKGEIVYGNEGGLRTNQALFVNHLYFMNDLQNDSIPIHFTFTPDSGILTNQKSLLLQRMNLQTDTSYSILHNKNQPFNDDILNFLRIQLLTEDDVQTADKLSELHIISNENEMKVFKTLLDGINDMINNYPTTYEEDKKKISSINDVTMKRIYSLIINEKEILIDAKKHCENKINNLISK